MSPLLIPAPPRRRRKRRRPRLPSAGVEVVVLSVVARPDGSARITFSAAVTLTAGNPGDTIHFTVEDRDGYAHVLVQDGADAIVATVDGLPIATNATWTIGPLPP